MMDVAELALIIVKPVAILEMSVRWAQSFGGEINSLLADEIDWMMMKNVEGKKNVDLTMERASPTIRDLRVSVCVICVLGGQ